MDKVNTSRAVRLIKKVSFALSATFLLLCGIELALRMVNFEYQPREKKLNMPVLAEFIGTYEFYIPYNPAPPGYMWVAFPNSPLTDSYGFRKPEIPINKPPGKIRVAFIGGSTTMAGERPFPYRTIRLINEAIGTNKYEMLNVAGPAYTTHQSLYALERWVFPRKPDIVVIYHGWNDIFLQGDGFRDGEKDILTKIGISSSGGRLAWVRHLRLAQCVGKLVDLADFSWPRTRVGAKRFRQNLRAMIEKCADRNITVVLIVRPQSQKRPFVMRYDELARRCYRREFNAEGTTEEIYNKIHSLVTKIQREVVQEYDNARICDACSYLNDVQKQKAQGEFGDRIEIFRDDACHLYAFGNQKLAEYMAICIAPEHEETIRKYIDRADYHEFLAAEFLKGEDPYEAVYHARQAMALMPERKQRLDELVKKAEGNYEFEKCFREGRWIGNNSDKLDFNAKLGRLKRCLSIRPSDIGVCLQIYSVCMYMGHKEMAANAMSGFNPATPENKYEWLMLTFQSHLYGKRWEDAARSAREMLSINPNDKNAQEYLVQALRGNQGKL